jgi:hypothetical protein
VNIRAGRLNTPNGSMNTGAKATYSTKRRQGCSTRRGSSFTGATAAKRRLAMVTFSRIIDWELTALQRRYRGRAEAELRVAIERNFLEIPFGEDRSPMIFVGNQENVQRRASFTVLGIYYPRKSDVEQI